jgi:hypothetical protein
VNRGILHSALTTMQRLEVDYRSPSICHESGKSVEQFVEVQYVERAPADEFARLLTVL